MDKIENISRLDSLDRKLRTILTHRLKYQLYKKYSPEQLEKFSSNFENNYLYTEVSNLMIDIDDLV